MGGLLPAGVTDTGQHLTVPKASVIFGQKVIEEAARHYAKKTDKRYI